MKKAIKALFVLLFIILTVSGAMAAEKKNKPEIKTVDNYVAVFDFEVTTGDKGISRPLADSVIHEFSQSGKYEVIDRGNMNKILGEQKFQMSGCVIQECKVEAGQILGVGKIVNGSVGILGKTYYLILQLIDVKTGKVELSSEDKCKCEIDELLDSTKRLTKKLLGEKVEQPVATVPKPVSVIESKAKAEAEEIVKSAAPEQKNTNSIGMTFVYIKPGTFMMGSPSDELGRDNDETQHQVTLTKGFYMQTTEVTQGQWEKIMGSNPSGFSNCGDDCPVEQVSWNEVQYFIQKLNQQEGTDRYRLPTEAEWEYAARAESMRRFFWGNQADCSRANYGVGDSSECKGINPGKTMKVGSFTPNEWGLYDMHGNICEWVQDLKGDYPASHVTDPPGLSSGLYRVNRGGSWFSSASNCRLSDRNFGAPDGRNDGLGFRLAKPP